MENFWDCKMARALYLFQARHIFLCGMVYVVIVVFVFVASMCVECSCNLLE